MGRTCSDHLGMAFPTREVLKSSIKYKDYNKELRRWTWKTGSFLPSLFFPLFFLKLHVEEKEAN